MSWEIHIPSMPPFPINQHLGLNRLKKKQIYPCTLSLTHFLSLCIVCILGILDTHFLSLGIFQSSLTLVDDEGELWPTSS